MNKKVVFILGIGRSGSTLLDLILAAHPQCFSLGEISKFHQIYTNPNMTLSSQCQGSTFWEETFSEEELKRLSIGLSNRRINPFIPLKVERFVRELFAKDDIFNSYSLILSKIEENILIDSSKYFDWVSNKQVAREIRDGIVESYIIYLIRDGRAVINSYLRRYPNRTIQQISKNWIKQLQGSQNFYQQFNPENRKMIVRYEQLAKEPQQTLETICQTIGIDFNPEMLEYWKYEHCGVAGGQGARALVKKFKQEDLNKQVAEVHGDYYKKAPLGIKLDLRWKQELSSENLAEFYRITGDLNKPFEWDEDDVVTE